MGLGWARRGFGVGLAEFDVLKGLGVGWTCLEGVRVGGVGLTVF